MLVQIVTENGQKKVIPLTADAGAGNPVGTIIPMYKKSSPSGYLYCDGSTFDETKYPLLYAYLGSNVLPDYREFALVGAEQNTTDTIATHDVFTEGQFKDDSFKSHNHTFTGTAGTVSVSGGNHCHTYYTGGNGGAGANACLRSRTQESGGDWNKTTAYSGNLSMSGSFTPSGSISNTGGDVTRGKRKAVYFYIKATSGLSENAQDNVLAQLNEERSYSTEEHLTGKKWIDGKPIYRKVIDIGALPNATSKSVAHNISNLGQVVILQGVATNPDAQSSIPLPCVYPPDINYSVGLFRVGANINIEAMVDVSGYNAYVIIEYTKTTD